MGGSIAKSEKDIQRTSNHHGKSQHPQIARKECNRRTEQIVQGKQRCEEIRINQATVDMVSREFPFAAGIRYGLPSCFKERNEYLGVQTVRKIVSGGIFGEPAKVGKELEHLEGFAGDGQVDQGPGNVTSLRQFVTDS
jgi:hypothetical protein